MVDAVSSAMHSVVYPVGEHYIWNLILPITLALGGLSSFRNEASGKNTAYSRFARDSQKQQIPSRLGMFILYFPAMLVALYWLFTLGDAESLGRVKLLATLLSVHFAKRVLEVLFLHKFSGRQDIDTALFISFTYAFNTYAMLINQYNVATQPSPSLDLAPLGVVLFAVGALGNLYHHLILAGLKKDENGGYRTPEGGLFDEVICAHYLFEIIDFVGLAMVSQTYYGIAWATFTAAYLAGRSIATRKWYLKKVEDFPQDRKNLIPFLF